VGDFVHFGNEEVGVARVPARPVEAGEYLGDIAGYQAGEVSLKYFHSVVIDKLRRRNTA